jgi:superfamily II DNA or RNA helicase
MTVTSPDPRPYQTLAVAEINAHWARGRRRALLCLPTGAGKTVCAGAVLAPFGGRALALVHTRTLRQQTRRRLGGDGAVRVQTIQGVLARGQRIADVDAVFIDEVHHLASPSWHRVLALLPPGVRVIGCTATPSRADGTALGKGGAGFDVLVAPRGSEYSALVANGWLAPCRVVRPRGEPTPAEAYLEHGDGRPGILFAPTVRACEEAVRELERAGGVRGAVISAHTSDAVRARAFAAFGTAGGPLVLASPMALAEGFDAPEAAVCVLDRQCVHVGVYLQTAGRVLRPHPSKGPNNPAVLIDLRGASERHGSPLADRSYSLEGEPIRPAATPDKRRDAPRGRAGAKARAAQHTTAPTMATMWADTARAAGTALASVWRVFTSA